MKFGNFIFTMVMGIVFFSPTQTFSIATITQPIKTVFGTYTPQAKPFSPSVAPYTVPSGLTGVLYADKYSFSDSAMALLVKNGFVATPSNAQSLTGIYKATNDKKLPVFVTTDVVLHTFYKTYDNMLKIAEYNKFYDELDSLLHCMLTGIGRFAHSRETIP